ncbi:MAG: TetR/AcrR family transcriptional regulator [Lactococcus sp.]|uniref:TetR/AcrR family transcriptional regulator n=1 Tax=Pseudolactococcus carnosus TaxID=2749961 RepID=UPI001FBBFF7A|nr:MULTISPECIES: TetR/AcrR family transcriptional regulator [Lactococcus]MCJ1974787.1 TetR/AcrR family transcriptional regulator [Lactococcus carnosus]MCJ1978549.1 TetR/AcrR family transcriptional regulator [Lactococcus carnosus]MCJ1984863.1 TetR/AcrR family transcriptional regulator [Lactococcus carnosus]MCJ2001131.1 TetR/AcrR family transcriptional regulator [Lactococcus carnosus]MCJ2002767.1 TetR/AcrR family transcriptional regulator [Lactococcus carnosus]
MTKKIDLRVKRTNKLITQAFIKLLGSKTFDKITINDISDEAMINRATFYSHFKDKFDLFENIIDKFLGDFADVLDTENLVEENAINVKKIEGALTKFYEFVNENPDLAKIFITHSNKEILSKRLLMILSERYSEIFDSLDVRNEDLKIPTDFVVSYITSIFIGTVNWWIEQKNHEMSANEFASLVIKLISNGHLTVLGVNINRD